MSDVPRLDSAPAAGVPEERPLFAFKHNLTVVALEDTVYLEDNGDADILKRLQVDTLFAEHGVRPRHIRQILLTSLPEGVQTDITHLWRAAMTDRLDEIPPIEEGFAAPGSTMESLSAFIQRCIDPKDLEAIQAFVKEHPYRERPRSAENLEPRGVYVEKHVRRRSLGPMFGRRSDTP